MKNGFTLIELMFVISIIAILAAVAIPAYQDYKATEHCDGDQVCIAKVKADLRNRGHVRTDGVVVQPSSSVTQKSLQCVSGYVILPSGGQLLDDKGHGVHCQ